MPGILDYTIGFPNAGSQKKYHTHIPLVSNLNPSIKWGICLLKWWFSRAIPQVSWIISTQTSQQHKPHNLQFHWFIVFIQLFGILIMDHNPQSCSNIEISQMEVSENGGNPQIIKVIQPCFFCIKSHGDLGIPHGEPHKIDTLWYANSLLLKWSIYSWFSH